MIFVMNVALAQTEKTIHASYCKLAPDTSDGIQKYVHDVYTVHNVVCQKVLVQLKHC